MSTRLLSPEVPSRFLRPALGSAPALVALLWVGGVGCAHNSNGVSGPSAAPVTHLEMEPIKITATNGPEGVQIESFDAADLFEQGGKALSEKRYDDAIATYDRLLREFKESRFTWTAIYNAGLAHNDKKDWPGAIARFKTLVESYPDSADTKDALFHLGALYAETSNWPASGQVFAQLLERKDLSADDRLEALGRRGFAQFQLKDLDTAERTFRAALEFFRRIEREERLETDYFLALSHYQLGQVSHERFRAAPLRLPEQQMNADLDEKARQLLLAQRAYIDTIKLGNPGWAAVSGFQIASLYEELYDSFVGAPVPAELLRPAEREKLEVYYQELRKKIRVLLEKSVRTHEANLLMMERTGVQSEWREKSKLAYAKVQRLLDPSFRIEFAAPSSGSAAAAGSPATTGPRAPAAPPLPVAPSHGGAPSSPPSAADPQPGAQPPADKPELERKDKARPATGPIRQIL
jgi:tetratricopeptide (TPR) repeat protein